MVKDEEIIRLSRRETSPSGSSVLYVYYCIYDPFLDLWRTPHSLDGDAGDIWTENVSQRKEFNSIFDAEYELSLIHAWRLKFEREFETYD